MEVSRTGIKVFAGWESKGNNIKDRFPRRERRGFQGGYVKVARVLSWVGKWVVSKAGKQGGKPRWESGWFPRWETRMGYQGGNRQ